MSGLDITAIALGVVVLVVVAAFGGGDADARDASMRWEGHVAVGFIALIFAGPIWLAQGVVTVIATIAGGGILPWWLWAWVVLAPLAGLSPPVQAVRTRFGRARGGNSRWSTEDAALAAVRFWADQAWADTPAEPGWELRRTPPLPVSWPPPQDGSVLWFCYAERDDTPAVIEVAVPFARIILDPGGTPVVERLSDEVVSWGPQGIMPLAPETLGKSRGTRRSMVDDVRRGDPDGRLAAALGEWRETNGCIATHPSVEPHLPPR